MLTTTRLFNPLTGTELKEVLKKEFNAKLEDCELLVPHLTFPKVSYKLELTIESYPMNHPIKLKGERILGDPDITGDNLDTTISYEREIGETQETAPDKVREDNSIPTTRIERSMETGQMTDVQQPLKKTSITVGAGTRPKKVKPSRQTPPREQEPVIVEIEADADPENQLDDRGQPVSMNRF